MKEKARWRRKQDGGENKMEEKARWRRKTRWSNKMGEKTHEKTRKQENVGGYKMIAPHRINNLWKVKVKSRN